MQAAPLSQSVAQSLRRNLQSREWCRGNETSPVHERGAVQRAAQVSVRRIESGYGAVISDCSTVLKRISRPQQHTKRRRHIERHWGQGKVRTSGCTPSPSVVCICDHISEKILACFGRLMKWRHQGNTKNGKLKQQRQWGYINKY